MVMTKKNEKKVKRILVVDDDPGIIRLVGSLLTSHGYEVTSAADGLEALVKIKNEKPDLVVLDIMMPEVNGYDVCYQLRFNQEFEQVPIVILTIREQELDESISQKVNIEYIHKPVDSKVLLAKIEGLLSKEKSSS